MPGDAARMQADMRSYLTYINPSIVSTECSNLGSR